MGCGSRIHRAGIPLYLKQPNILRPLKAGLAIGKLQKLFAYSADLLSSTNNESVDLNVCDIISRYCNVTLLQTHWPHCTTCIAYFGNFPATNFIALKIRVGEIDVGAALLF